MISSNEEVKEIFKRLPRSLEQLRDAVQEEIEGIFARCTGDSVGWPVSINSKFFILGKTKEKQYRQIKFKKKS